MTTTAILEIPVLRASGTGGTSLAAFHAALAAVDLGHFNLVRLSSVIPPGTTVGKSGTADLLNGMWGDRLYCVYAEQHATEIGDQAWAGIGWVQRLDGLGGYFVEHEGHNEEFVAHAIQTSLSDIVTNEDGAFAEPEWILNGTVCTGPPVCSLVIAPYETASWAANR
jgi:arginine decarboxylase